VQAGTVTTLPGKVASATPGGVAAVRPLREPPASGTVQSVSRALQALELVASRRDGATAREVAAHLDLALPSTYHLLATLTASGYLVHLAQEHRYGLGYRVQLLEQGLARQLEVPASVAAAIAQLHHDADAAAYYAVYRDVDVVIAHVEDSARRPRVQALDVGFHEATHATAFGKVMLAAMDGATRERHLAQAGVRALTGQTVTDREELETQLAHVSASSIAVEINEFQEGLSCLASPVRSRAGAVVGAVAISLPTSELVTRRRRLERVVRHGAMVVTRAVTAASRGGAGRT
jgi:DNA-binding IclR family transcriptional regulator